MALVVCDPVASDPGRHGASAKAQAGAGRGYAQRPQPDSSSRTSRVAVVQAANDRKLEDVAHLGQLYGARLG